MPASFVDDLRNKLGLSGAQMADLLWIPRSGLTMAAGGHRPIPAHLLPFLILLQEIASGSGSTKNPAPAPGENISPMQAGFAQRQLRLLRMEQEKLQLQQERVDAKLEKAEKLCAWLPELLESAICESDPDRRASAGLLLRQSGEQRQQYWEQANHIQARLLGLGAAIGHWEKFI